MVFDDTEVSSTGLPALFPTDLILKREHKITGDYIYFKGVDNQNEVPLLLTLFDWVDLTTLPTFYIMKYWTMYVTTDYKRIKSNLNDQTLMWFEHGRTIKYDLTFFSVDYLDRMFEYKEVWKNYLEI